jgi:hypothetical protein
MRPARRKATRPAGRKATRPAGRKADGADGGQARLGWTATVIAAVIAAIGSVIAAVITSTGLPAASGTTPAAVGATAPAAVGATAPAAAGGATPAAAPAEPARARYAGGVTYLETVNSSGGARVYADPDMPSGEWLPGIANGAIVRASCKVYAPSIPSVSPDGYWYRLASAPWNNEYYSPANSYLNGDTPGKRLTHNTDFNVPDCPSQ